MTRLVVWVFAILNGVGVQAQDRRHREKLDGIAAVVGGQIVLDSDVQQLQFEHEMQYKGSKDKCDALNDLMLQKLLLNQAKSDSAIKVNEESVQRQARERFNIIAEKNGVSKQQLLDFYNETEPEMISKIAQMIRDGQLMAQERNSILKDVDVSPQEVSAFCDSISKGTPPEVDEEAQLSRIVKYPIISEASKQKVIDTLKQIRREVLREGPARFRTKAIIYSEDPKSASKGGEYKNVKRGKFPKEFEAVAFNMEAGQLSEPFETELGFYIIQLLRRHGEQIDLRCILMRAKPNQEELNRTVHYMDSIKGLIQQGVVTFEDAARQFSDDALTKRNGGRMSNPNTQLRRLPFSDMDPDMYLAGKDLKKGEISAPTYADFEDKMGSVKKAYILYKMDDRFPPHKLNYALDFQRLKTRASAEKKEKKLLEWQKSKVPDTFIQISPAYQDCQKLKPWLAK